MPLWSGKTRGGVTGYKTFIFILKSFGLGFAYFILNFVVVYFIFTSPKSIKAAFYYFRNIHKYGFFRTLFFIWKNYYVFGQTLIDKVVILSGLKNKLHFEYEGENYLHNIASDKTGGMLISAHIGSFEIASYLLKRIQTKANILMFEAEHENIKNFLSSVYKDMPANIITIKDDMSHIYDIKSVFENKEFLCLHGDRFLDGTKTIQMKFMGREARFPVGPFFLALKFNIPVSFVFPMKHSKYSYHFYATPPKFYYQERQNLKQRDFLVSQIIADYIGAFENVLKKYPEQWFNFYYFWERNKD
ncbi:MAG: hypothetical protein PHT69_01385 [Bacteroidales bacterium]|nr:hypothetical protein [Bacteroidales bacterium]